jgi:hypothetical protein
MNILKSLDQLSFGKIFSIAIVSAIIISVPVGVILIQQETRISSRAAYEKPKISTKTMATPGPIPTQAPQIGRLFPWVGKIGDIVWLQGENFGINPASKKLTIGGIQVTDEQIEAWEDTQIQTTIPSQARQGGVAEVQVGDHSKSQSLPYILYDATTKTKIRKTGNILSIEQGTNVLKAVIWTGDDEIPTQKHEVAVDPLDGNNEFFDTQNLPILSIVLLDQQGKIVPYYVDPIEFDF